MIYVEYDENGTVTYRHNFPLDENTGMGKTEAELLASGALVEAAPEPDKTELEAGKVAVEKYDPGNNEIYYEYTTPSPAKMNTEEKVEFLQEQLDTLALEILKMKGLV
jgi:hypothetical protein